MTRFTPFDNPAHFVKSKLPHIITQTLKGGTKVALAENFHPVLPNGIVNISYQQIVLIMGRANQYRSESFIMLVVFSLWKDLLYPLRLLTNLHCGPVMMVINITGSICRICFNVLLLYRQYLLRLSSGWCFNALGSSSNSLQICQHWKPNYTLSTTRVTTSFWFHGIV